MTFNSNCQSILMTFTIRRMNVLMKDQKQKAISYLKAISLEIFQRTKGKYSSYQKTWQEINYKSNQR